MALDKESAAQRRLPNLHASSSSTRIIVTKLSTRIVLFLLYILLCKLSVSQTQSTGVVEVEIVNVQRLDTSQASAAAPGSLRLLVCLKEPYASQLDGPCAFGNASITLSQSIMTTTSRQTLDEHQRQLTLINNRTEQAIDKEIEQQQQQKQQQESHQLTNVVRIPFTFRWTKTFTIILTVEQIDESSSSSSSSTGAQNGAALTTTTTTTTTTNGPAQQQLQQQQINARANQSADSPQLLSPLNGTSLVNNSVGTGTKIDNHHHQTKPLSPSATFIGRHVVTENEVLPSLETISNKFWTTREMRDLKSSVVYRFRVYCSLNYYGDDCTSFCRPRDDQFGHYNCSSTGHKVCLEGWHGQACDKAKCRAGCNQQHGYCEKPDTCQCRPGWEGPRCDECTKYPGCQHGYCLQPWQCQCNKYWGGVLCDQDLNYCLSQEPCANNATCQNVAPGRYKCHCPDGYTGVNCEIKLSTLIDMNSSMTKLSAGCALNPCLNGGTCYGFNSQLIESGANGDGSYNRAITEVPMETALLARVAAARAEGDRIEALSSTASGGELADESGLNVVATTTTTTTTTTGRSYRCQCPAGFTGDYCQWAESISLISGELPPIIDNQAQINSRNNNNSNFSNLSFSTSFSSLAANPLNNSGGGGDEEEAMLAAAAPPPQLHQPEIGIAMEQANTIMATENVNSAQTIPVGPVSIASHNLEMRHLISGVVIASAIGVFCAALMLAWCCLMAIEKGGFHFIQMNIIRHGTDDTENSSSAAVSSTLRRVHEKIRDSFRRSPRLRNKQDSKYGIEDAFGSSPVAPPSYEESNYNTIEQHKRKQQHLPQPAPLDLVGDKSSVPDANDEEDNLGIISVYEAPAPPAPVKHNNNLVKRGALGQMIDLKKSPPLKAQPPMLVHSSMSKHDNLVDPIMNCPKHGHLYRKHQQHHHDNYLAAHCPQQQQASTTIEIAYKPTLLQTKSQEMVVYSQVNRHRNQP